MDVGRFKKTIIKEKHAEEEDMSSTDKSSEAGLLQEEPIFCEFPWCVINKVYLILV